MNSDKKQATTSSTTSEDSSSTTSEDSQICITPDKITTHPQLINDQFKKFYADIYTSEANGDTGEVQEFLDKLDIPQISSETQTLIDAPITCEEILQAISSLQSGKAAGPDWISIEFYKAFSNKLASMINLTFYPQKRCRTQ